MGAMQDSGTGKGAAAGGVPAEAVAAVKEFLRCAVDKGDEAGAKAVLSKATLESGSFNMQAEMVGAKYSVGEAMVEAGQVFVPVEIEAGGMKQVLPFAPGAGGWGVETGHEQDDGEVDGGINGAGDGTGGRADGGGDGRGDEGGGGGAGGGAGGGWVDGRRVGAFGWAKNSGGVSGEGSA